ncbi:MAG: flagellar basal body rod protein FlgC [Oscillospiraceae bacterium]|nr:flagellar basal body rod protein FlgC [Oscillospiraceae bacterium]
MAFLRTLGVSASALTAQSFRMDVISENIANAEVTRTADGDPYRRRNVIMGERTAVVSFADELEGARNRLRGDGVQVVEVYEDQSDFKMVYNPGHPDADENGYVSYPNVDTVTEMVDLISATRSYEANVTAFNATKSMSMKALDIGK